MRDIDTARIDVGIACCPTSSRTARTGANTGGQALRTEFVSDAPIGADLRVCDRGSHGLLPRDAVSLERANQGLCLRLKGGHVDPETRSHPRGTNATLPFASPRDPHSGDLGHQRVGKAGLGFSGLGEPVPQIVAKSAEFFDAGNNAVLLGEWRKWNQYAVQYIEVDVLLCCRRGEVNEPLSRCLHKDEKVPCVVKRLRRYEADNTVGKASVEAQDRAVGDICCNGDAQGTRRPKSALSKTDITVVAMHFRDELARPRDFASLNQRIDARAEEAWVVARPVFRLSTAKFAELSKARPCPTGGQVKGLGVVTNIQQRYFATGPAYFSHPLSFRSDSHEQRACGLIARILHHQ